MIGGEAIQSGAKPDGVVLDILTGSAAGMNANSPEEQDVLRKVLGMYQKAKAWKANWSKNYDRWWNLWESNHYHGKRVHSLTQAVINQVWSACETFVAHISEGISEPLARARLPKFKAKSKAVEKWLRYEADQNNLGQELEHPARSACVTGAGWFKVDWDEKKFDGRGDASIRAVDERFIFPSPHSRDYRDLLYLIEAKNVPRDFVVRGWEKGNLVPPGIMDITLENARLFDERGVDSASPNFMQVTTTTGSDSAVVGSNSAWGSLRKSDLVTLIECYARQEDGSMRLTVISNGIVLQDGPSPYDDEDFPYAVVNILPTLDTIQGRGLVQFIEGLQEILDNSISYLLDQQRFASDPMMIVDVANLEDGQLIDNSPGAVLPNSNPNGRGYEWMQAPGFNQAWLQIQEIVSGYMDTVLGRVEILQGENPTGVSTLGGLEVLRDEANIRLRKHIKWVQASMKRVYLLTLSRLRQFAKDKRTLLVNGENGQEDYVTVNPVTGIGAGGEIQQDMTIPSEAEFDIEFGKDVPGGQQARMEQAIALASTPAEDGLPMVDRQWVLEQCDVEEAPEIMQRLAQMQSQMAAQQQQQAAGAEGAPEAPVEGNPLDPLTKLFSGVAA